MKSIFLFIFFLSGHILLFGQSTDEQGRKQGYWKKKDEKTNRLIYEGRFKDNQPVGTFKYYHINDSVQAIIQFKEGSSVAYARLFHLNGKRMAEGKYVGKEIKDSVWNYYDESGVLLSKETFLKGKKEGMSYVYFPDGVVSEQRQFKNGLEDGLFKQFFDKNVIRAQGNYNKGQQEGKFVYYFPNGVEVASGFYKNGLKNGPWIYRSENGKITEKELYKNGELASKKETDAFFAKTKIQNQTPKAENKKAEVKPKNSDKSDNKK